MSEILKIFQNLNCIDCIFANAEKVGTGLPCCTYPGKLILKDGLYECSVKRTQKNKKRAVVKSKKGD